MRTRSLFIAGVLAIAGLGMIAPAQDEKAKFTIKEVMDKAHKSKLYAKVADGKASKEEKELLLAGYEALALSKPPKGDAASWQEKTKALVDAAKECIKDEKAGGPKLKKAADCMGCHKAHKG